MANDTPHLNVLEQQIIAYLEQHGPTHCQTIAADLGHDPIAVLKTLWNLQDHGYTRFLRHTIYHELCPVLLT